MGETHPVSGFTLLSGSVEDRIHEALPARQVILNPPRGGADPQVMEVLQTASGIGRIVYVSCDPATLARDLARLGPGYTLKRLQALDLFPQTAHVETIVTLEPSRRG
jgi:23S rRNA (uracil1939-C5)-methyltransferase